VGYWAHALTLYKENTLLRILMESHCAVSQEVAGLIPDGVIGIFHCLNPSGCTMALWSTQPQIEMSTRDISWGVKVAGA
jgi:hypothetical protein